MSKTDKDIPYWVQARRHGVPRHRHLDRRGVPRPCDLEEDRNGFSDCYWTLPLRRSNCPTEYARLTYYRPENARVRVAVEKLRREYNAYGNLVDPDVMCTQHRHTGLYDRD